MPSQIPLVDIITRLDTYSDLHSKGSSSLKSCIWNISIARRQKGLYSCSAADVREELRAHAILEYVDYPELSYEDIVEEPNEEKNIQEHFVLNFGGIPEKQEMVRKNTDSESSNGFGLRQRKGKESPKTIKSEWTESAFEDEQEEILRKVDPLELFGALPPKELKTAQRKAKETLENYVKAANKVKEILRIMEASP